MPFIRNVQRQYGFDTQSLDLQCAAAITSSTDGGNMVCVETELVGFYQRTGSLIDQQVDTPFPGRGSEVDLHEYYANYGSQKV